MKLGDVVNALPALQKLAGENLTPKTLYWVSKMLSKLDGEINFFNDERAKIAKELGNEVETDKWEIPVENRPEFERRMVDLLNVEIEAEFKVVKLPVTENIRLSYNDLRMLDGFVELELAEDDEN